MGTPLLKQVALPVARFDADLAALVADMDDTMRALSGAGIAAPQIGVSLRVVIFELRENPRYPHIAPVPYTVLVNPVLTPLGSEEDEGWEGCLSVPGLRGLVRAYGACAIKVSISMAWRSIARWKASTRASCSTRLITSMEFCFRRECATCATLGLKMHSSDR